jgi:hypothetical protein
MLSTTMTTVITRLSLRWVIGCGSIYSIDRRIRWSPDPRVSLGSWAPLCWPLLSVGARLAGSLSPASSMCLSPRRIPVGPLKPFVGFPSPRRLHRLCHPYRMVIYCPGQSMCCTPNYAGAPGMSSLSGIGLPSDDTTWEPLQQLKDLYTDT